MCIRDSINDKLCYGIVNFLPFVRNAADFHTPGAEFVLACDRPKRSFHRRSALRLFPNPELIIAPARLEAARQIAFFRRYIRAEQPLHQRRVARGKLREDVYKRQV